MVRPEQIYAIIDINNEKCIIPTKLIGIDPHYNLAVLHIGKYETPFFQWKKGKSRNMKPGEIVFTIGYRPDQNQTLFSLASDIQAGILCANNYTGEHNPGECIITSGITKCSLGSPLINDNGHVVGIYTGNGIWLSEYSMRAVIRSLCKFEFSPIQTTSGKYILYPRKFIGCIAKLYKGEYFFTNPNQETSLIAGYKIVSSFVDNIIPGDIMTHIVVDQKQYTLGCGRRQISASTVIEKSTDKITVKGFRISHEPIEPPQDKTRDVENEYTNSGLVLWEVEITPSEWTSAPGLI